MKKILTRQAFKKHLERRHSLRVHMFLILLTTALSGVLFSKILLYFVIADFRIRYPLAVVFSYLVFFVCIRLWLSYVGSIRESNSVSTGWLDLIPNPSSGGGIGKEIPAFRGGGGQFAGAGASGSFEGPDQTLARGVILADSERSFGQSASEGGGGVAEKVAGALGGDDNIVVAVIVLAILVITILASTAVLLYDAPSILSEAAFEGALATSLIRRTRALGEKAWAGSVLKATWKPFAVILVVAFLSGIVLRDAFPDADSLMEILQKP